MSPPNRARIRRRRIVLPLVAGCLAACRRPRARAPDDPPPQKTPATTDLAIAKASDRAAYQPGETIAYSITVTNLGTSPVARADILVSDPMLADLAPADGAGAGGPDLAPGASLVYTGTRVVTDGDCGPLANTATVAVSDGKKQHGTDANPANDSATHVVDVGGEKCAPAVAVSGIIAKPAAPPSPAREAQPQSQPAVCPPPKLRAMRGRPAEGCAPGRPPSSRSGPQRQGRGRRAPRPPDRAPAGGLLAHAADRALPGQGRRDALVDRDARPARRAHALGEASRRPHGLGVAGARRDGLGHLRVGRAPRRSSGSPRRWSTRRGRPSPAEPRGRHRRAGTAAPISTVLARSSIRASLGA